MSESLSAPAAVAQDRLELARTRRSPRLQVLLSLLHDRMAVLGFSLFLIMIVAALFAPQLAPYSPTAVKMRERFQGPSLHHLLGTDELGRDLLSRIIYGARASMSVGVVAVGIALTFGVIFGLISAYYGRRVDAVVMRAMDGLLAFPAIILAMAIMTALGPSLINAMIAIGIVFIPSFSRIIRGSVLSLKEKEFVEAARAAGARDCYVMFRTLLPNAMSPLLVQVTVAFANAILTEAALSFLGVGIQPPTPSWGQMLDTGRKYLDQTGWYSFTAGAAIFLAVLSLNLVGDGLRDALDPRLHVKR